MNVLMISLDKNLESASSEVFLRQRHYAKMIDNLDIVVFSAKNFIKSSDNLNVFGIGGKFKFTQFIKGLVLCWRLSTSSDLITSQDPFFTALIAYIISKLKNIPFVIELHGDFFSKQWGQEYTRRRFFLLILAKFLLRRTNRIRVVNPLIKEDLFNLGVKKDSIRVIPLSVNLDAFKQVNDNEVCNIRDQINGKPIILFVGRLVKTKGVDILIKAFGKFSQKYPSAKLLIIGDGEEAENLKLAAKAFCDRILFKGFLSQRELAQYYHACDIFVLPSRHESFGRVILEAGAAARPIVATKTAGAVWIIEDGKNGYLIDIDDIDGIFNKLCYVWDNYNKADEVGKNLSKIINERFNYKYGVDNLIKFWKSAL